MNLCSDRYDVYIGRAGRGHDGYFGNPFRLGPGASRGSTIARFEAYFLERVERDAEFRRHVLDLRGKRLGCFCAPWPCHGDVIARWVDAQPAPSAPATASPESARRVAIVGSRDFPRLDLVRRFVESLPPGTLVISGGTRGVDRAAVDWARGRGLPWRVFDADWDRYGRSAGFRRNPVLVAASTEVHAFWDGVSNGTGDSIQCAQQQGRPITIHAPDGSQRILAPSGGPAVARTPA